MNHGVAAMSLDDSIFADVMNGRKPKRPPMTISRLIEVERIRPDIIAKFLAAVRAGAGFTTAAGLLGVSPETVKRWMERGSTAKKGPYRQFYDKVMNALQVAGVVAEAKVKEMQPLQWLKAGPGRWVTDDWQDQPKRIEQTVEVQGGYTVEGKVQIQHVDVISALKELKSAGISLDSLTLEAVAIQSKDEAEEGDPEDEDEATSVGTNYLGYGKHHSFNPSLPQKMRTSVEAIEVHPESKNQKLEEVGVTTPSLMDRLKRMG